MKITFQAFIAIAVASLGLAGCKTHNVELKPVATSRSPSPVSNPIAEPVNAQIAIQNFQATVKWKGAGRGGCRPEIDQNKTFRANYRSAVVSTLEDVFASMEVVPAEAVEARKPQDKPTVYVTPIYSKTRIIREKWTSKYTAATDVILMIKIMNGSDEVGKERIRGEHSKSRTIGNSALASKWLLGHMAGTVSCEQVVNWTQESFMQGFRNALDKTKEYLIESRGLFAPATST